MTRLGTILRRQVRPFRNSDRFSLTPAGIAALDACKPANEQNDLNDAETALRGAQEVTEAFASFAFAPCDFCPAFTLTYTDPETQGRYCLPCLEVSTDPLEDGPEDAAIVQMGREVIAARRAARNKAA